MWIYILANWEQGPRRSWPALGFLFASGQQSSSWWRAHLAARRRGFCVRSATLNSKINIDRARARAHGTRQHTGNNTSKYIFTFAVANIHAEIIRANLSVDEEAESGRQPARAAAAAVVQLVLQLADLATVLALRNRVADQPTWNTRPMHMMMYVFDISAYWAISECQRVADWVPAKEACICPAAWAFTHRISFAQLGDEFWPKMVYWNLKVMSNIHQQALCQ